jgi:tRNA threonylcarbamoyladenosine biosynthesis protein TsaB
LKVLAFDTATRATTAALWDTDGIDPPREARDDPDPGERPGHARYLLPLISELLERSGTGWEEIETLAVGVGPGTFTGLRIGIATARALSRARRIPLVGVSTLESLALGPRLDPRLPADIDTLLSVIDARRGEVFAASWPVDDGPPEPATPRSFGPRAVRPERLATNITGLGGRVIAVGDGAVEFREVLEPSGASIPADDSELHRVSATNHCRLASGKRAGRPDEVSPEYLRLPDAKIAHRDTDKQ